MAKDTSDNASDSTSSNASNGKTGIGALNVNGKWGFLFKAVLITTPAAWAAFVTVDLPWRVWVTRSTFSVADHLHASEKLEQRIEQLIQKREADWRDIDKRIEDLPSPVWRARIIALENFERENKADHLKILIALEGIKIKLDTMARQGLNGSDGTNGTRLPFYNEGSDNETISANSGGSGSDPVYSGGG
jgi:hypothetical protein